MDLAGEAQGARADGSDTPPPCSAPSAATLADRPGTGRATSSGGSTCVALPGEIVFESGFRDQITQGTGGSSVLISVPLTFVRLGVANRVELSVAPPAYQSRSDSGLETVNAASGQSDLGIALKYLLLDASRVQASLGGSYSVPTGSGEFTAGAPTYSASVNIGVSLTSRLSFSTSQIAATAVGATEGGVNRVFFVYAPSLTLGYALDNVDTLFVQDAITSRQGPLLPAGNRGFVALQRAFGPRLAVDVEYEKNFAPTLGNSATAIGFGLVWIVAPPRM